HLLLSPSEPWVLIHILLSPSEPWVLIHLLLSPSEPWVLIHLLLSPSEPWVLIHLLLSPSEPWVLIHLLLSPSEPWVLNTSSPVSLRSLGINTSPPVSLRTLGINTSPPVSLRTLGIMTSWRRTCLCGTFPTTPMEHWNLASILRYHTERRFLTLHGGNLHQLFKTHPVRYNVGSCSNRGPSIPVVYDHGDTETTRQLYGPSSRSTGPLSFDKPRTNERER
uniref:Uncharacterized protein n=1 Tax=Salmo trutta TaxID=8032 RepID=A0A674A9Q6_SALTR